MGGEIGFSDAKSPRPNLHAAGYDENAKGLRPPRALLRFCDSLGWGSISPARRRAADFQFEPWQICLCRNCGILRLRPFPPVFVEILRISGRGNGKEAICVGGKIGFSDAKPPAQPTRRRVRRKCEKVSASSRSPVVFDRLKRRPGLCSKAALLFCLKIGALATAKFYRKKKHENCPCNQAAHIWGGTAAFRTCNSNPQNSFPTCGKAASEAFKAKQLHDKYAGWGRLKEVSPR